MTQDPNRWAGRKVAQANALVRSWCPAPCGKCGKTVYPTEKVVTGHRLPRWSHPHLTWDPSNWQPEHDACSRASAQKEVVAKARHEGAMAERKRLATLGAPRGPETTEPEGSAHLSLVQPSGPHFSGEATPGNLPQLPSSLPSAHTDRREVPDRLKWSTFCASAPSWLTPFVTVPGNSSPPLAITPVHPQAAGSYGQQAIEWIEAERNITLRWWQALAIVRQLEHREDGSLCWRFVVESAPRRAGKSERLRSMALWRMEHGNELFEPDQIVVHIARDLGIAREVQEMAYSWCRARGFKISTANGKERVQHKNGARWLLKAKDGVYGFDGHAIIADECWDLSPSAISDGAEPAMRHRSSPQLVMTSTSHPRATSLMPSKIAAALAEEDGRTLLLLWAAPWGADFGDPQTWRDASPYWVEEEDGATMSAAHAEALNSEPTLDNPDPLGSFVAQYLNVWSLGERRRQKGEAVTDEEAWAALTVTTPRSAPVAAAIESGFSEGVTLCLGWRAGDRAIVSASDHPDLESAVTALKASGFRGRVTVGSSMKDDPALHGVRLKPGQGRTGASVADLRNLLREGGIWHDGGPHLTGQVLGIRTMPGADGPRIVSTGRADAVKATVWAANAARAVPASFKIVRPSS